eukprot:gene38091-49937_t
MDSTEVMSKNVIHVWCGPRSLSTCTMYSFAQRPDCTVYDEPLYASFLKENPEIYRPYRDQLIEFQSCSPNDILSKMMSPSSRNVVYAKHMAKHLTNHIDRSILYGPSVRHVLLVRDPFEMIASWSNKQEVHQEGCSLDAT